jgi:hypothetical protein
MALEHHQSPGGNPFGALFDFIGCIPMTLFCLSGFVIHYNYSDRLLNTTGAVL